MKQIIEPLREEWQVPGVAVAVVNDQEVVYAEGFGWRDIENNLPVTPNTLFAIGSVTKSFVATGIGLLVDEGKLDWDTPIRHYLPWFKLYDSFATERITPRDLLTHRSGLPRHEKMWWKSNATRRELIERLQYLQPNADLRAVFQYQNMMYVTAGYLAGEIAGTSWEDFTQQRIFDPLGMTHSNFSVHRSQQLPDYAQPYIKHNNDIDLIPFCDLDNCAPAGAINSNLVDLAKWLQLQLNRGKADFISEKVLNEIHTPQILIHDPVFRQLVQEDFLAYGMGWFISPYRGRTILRHSGGIDGFITQTAFIPSEKLAVIIFANLNETYLPSIALFSLIDHLLKLDPIDWNTRVKEAIAKGDEAIAKAREGSASQQVPNTKPSHPLEAYVGAYEHPGYGVLTIEKSGNALQVVYNGVPSPLTHYHYDIFELYNEMYEDNKWIKANFQTEIDGTVRRVALRLELLVEPIVFVKK